MSKDAKSEEFMIVFSVDPGTATTGWAVLAGNSYRQKLLAGGLVETDKTHEQNRRLAEIYQTISQKLQEFKADLCVIEQLFFNTNAKTALLVGQTHGVVRLAAYQAKIAVVEYTPLEVKMAITGYGRAEKKQIKYMVQKILKLPNTNLRDDVYDAIAIGLCHFFRRKNSFNR